MGRNTRQRQAQGRLQRSKRERWVRQGHYGQRSLFILTYNATLPPTPPGTGTPERH